MRKPTNPSIPQKFNEYRKSKHLDLSEDSLEVSFKPINTAFHNEGDYYNAMITTSLPIPPFLGIYYFEVFILENMNTLIAIGVVNKPIKYNNLPGILPFSFALHSNGNFLENRTCKLQNCVYHFETGDLIGCGINFITNSCFFTKNGNFLFEHPLGADTSELHVQSHFPSLGLRSPGQRLRANFGENPLLFDLPSFVANERKKKMDSIMSTVKLRGGGDTTIRKLISSYLLSQGYIEAYSHFNADNVQQVQANIEQAQRRKSCIEALTRHSDPDACITLINHHYPLFFEKNGHLLPLLQSLKLIRLLKQKPLDFGAILTIGTRLSRDAKIHKRKNKPYTKIIENILSLTAYPDPSLSPHVSFLSQDYLDEVVRIINAALLEEINKGNVDNTLSILLKHLFVCFDSMLTYEIPESNFLYPADISDKCI